MTLTILSRAGAFLKPITLQQRTPFTGATFKAIILENHQNMSTTTKSGPPVFSHKECKRFIVQCLEASKTSKDHAEIVADHLVMADYRGYYSHGMNRLEMYINDLNLGACDGKAKCKILLEGPSTAWVDGQNGLGQVVGKFCMDLAVKKAKESGISCVSAKRSNHFGIGSVYTLQAIEQGLLGMCFSNTSPLMSPTRSKKPALGTNPLSLGAPAEKKDFILDMATTAVAVGKIELQRRKNQPIPKGWAQDTEGHTTTDPEVAVKAGCLMPLGGTEDNSGYKGFGLALLVEIYCGILAGAHFGPFIRRWGGGNKEARDIGHCFIAVNPNLFAPGFEARLNKLLEYLRNMEPADPEKPVLTPGDVERLMMSAADKKGGLCYVPDQLKTCQRLAETLKVAPLKPL